MAIASGSTSPSSANVPIITLRMRSRVSPGGLGDRLEQGSQSGLVLAARERLEAEARHGRRVRVERQLEAREQAVGLAVVRDRRAAARAPRPRGRRPRGCARAAPARRRGRARARSPRAATPRRRPPGARRKDSGSRPSTKRWTVAGGCAPVNSSTSSPSRKALTFGIPWMPKRRAMFGLASMSILTSSTAPSVASTALSITGASL